MDDKSEDSRFSGSANSNSFEESYNSVEKLKEKMEEDKRNYNKYMEQKNGKVIYFS